jgi:hypothetical protein
MASPRLLVPAPVNWRELAECLVRASALTRRNPVAARIFDLAREQALLESSRPKPIPRNHAA